jgi:predicted dienelactone hydrolase
MSLVRRQSRWLRRLLLVPAIAAFVLAVLVMHVSAYGFAMVDGDRAESVTTRLAGGPYGDRGPHPVGVRTVVIDGEPSLEATMWYPADPAWGSEERLTYPYELKLFPPVGRLAIASHVGQASRDAPYDLDSGAFPLVVLSPGYAIGSASYGWLAEHLTSHGFVVIAPEHDEQLNPARIWESTISRPQDTKRVLSFVGAQSRSGGALEGLIDPERTAVIGHSYGGYTALAAAGARVDTAAFEARCRAEHAARGPNTWLCDALVPHIDEMADRAGLATVPDGLWPAWNAPAVDAIVSMAGDAYLFDHAGLAEVSLPVLAIGGTADTDTPYTWGTEPTYAFTSSTRKAKLTLDDAGHMIFTGPCDRVRRVMKILPGGFCTDRAWDRLHAQAVVRHFTTAFLLAELTEQNSAAEALASSRLRVPGVSYESEGYREPNLTRG